MKPPGRDPFSEDDLDALLGGRLKDTTPEFEARWVALRRDLRTAPPRRNRLPPWAAWLALTSALGALAAILLVLPPRPAAPPPARNPVPDVDELLTMDAVLRPATALLDAENRDALIHLPAPPPPHT